MKSFLKEIESDSAKTWIDFAYSIGAMSCDWNAFLDLLKSQTGPISCGFDTECIQDIDLSEVGIVVFDQRDQILFWIKVAMKGFGAFGDEPGSVPSLTEKMQKRAQRKDLKTK